MGANDYSTTPGSNTTVNSINIGEGNAPSTVNNAIRQIMADIGSFLNWPKHTAATTLVAYHPIQADTVTTGAFTATLPTSPSAGHWCAVYAASSWAANNLTIGHGGSTIRGVASDLVLSDAIGAAYVFYYDGSTWQYSGGYLATSGGTMTGILREAKGADVASATALTLGTDGNSFDITGTTAITSINSLGVGSRVTLQFDDALTLTHHATDLILPGGANITTVAGDIAVFVEYASGDWRCVSYTRGASSPDSGFPSGTLMLFQQTAAPTGWTKQTTHNDKALRVVSGTAGSGGSSAFSTVFGLTATQAHTLTQSEMPSHTHSRSYQNGAGSADMGLGSGTPGSLASGSTGGGGSHSHNIDLRVQYVDLIIASKD
jgi:hypothetical protein